MGIQIEEKSYTKKHIIKLIVILALVSAVAIAGLITFGGVGAVSDIDFKIEDGMTMSTAVAELDKQGVTPFPNSLKLISRVLGYDTKIKPGIAKIKSGMSSLEILDKLTNPSPDLIKVVIPEGLEAKEIAEKFSAVVPEADLIEAMKKHYDYKFLENLPEREYPLEGYLFPDTYEVDKTTSAEEIINMMLKNFDEHFRSEYYARAKELNMSVDQIITLASIVERESNSSADRAKIAGVFYNRLNKNMRLQSCATVQYILKERKTVLSVEDTKIESPYNTYRNNGLPIGPIASPGAECIKAALYPEATNALFFVLGEDGKHIFSETFEEHVNAKHGE